MEESQGRHHPLREALHYLDDLTPDQNDDLVKTAHDDADGRTPGAFLKKLETLFASPAVQAILKAVLPLLLAMFAKMPVKA